MRQLSCFKAYDIRGRVDDNLTDDIAYRLGKAFGRVLEAKCVVVGRDIRASSPRLLDALAKGLQDVGCDVFDLGLCGTEEVYFATSHINADGGVMVTASHNPIDHNGFKLVGPRSTPLSDATFQAVKNLTGRQRSMQRVAQGKRVDIDCRDAFVDCVTSFIDPSTLAPLHVLANPGNGAAGPTLDAVLDGLADRGAKLRVTQLFGTPDPTFPNGIPNPLLPENQPVTGQAVLDCGADLGLAWDGDFDRCFFFDEEGGFVQGEYIVGAIAEAVLSNEPTARIVHDPRVMWNTQRIVDGMGGRAVLSKTGHALVKVRMRAADAAYGGEMSAHHYFRDFMFCDSGMIPWLLILDKLSKSGRSLKEIIDEMRRKHPSSGEINFRVTSPLEVVRAVRDRFVNEVVEIDELDGLSMSFADWRFNLRSSNTEPLLRLNVETLGDLAGLETRSRQISEEIQRFSDL